MTVEEAAERMNVSKQFIRFGLRHNRLPFGVAVKISTRYTYFIDKKKFERYMNGGDAECQ